MAIKTIVVVLLVLTCNDALRAQAASGEWDTTNTHFTFGPDGPIYTIGIDSGRVYIGGVFAEAKPTVSLRSIAKWDDTTWIAIGTGSSSGANRYVRGLTFADGRMYVVGAFDSVCGVSAGAISYRNNGAWYAMGSGFNKDAYAIVVRGSRVYAGGAFDSSGTRKVRHVAAWTGTTWDSLGPGVNGYVTSLAMIDTVLYVGGFFESAGGVQSRGVVKWNGNSWSSLGGGVNGSVHALAAIGDTLYVGGAFDSAGSIVAKNVAYWASSAWHTMDDGIDGPVLAISGRSGAVYFGGMFVASGTDTLNNIAMWDGDSWGEMHNGTDGPVHALAYSDSLLHVGGDFFHAGGSRASRYAIWSETSLNKESRNTLTTRQKAAATLRVMPVPANDHVVLWIYFPEAGTAKIFIRDELGRLVYSSLVSSARPTIQTERWSTLYSGTFFATVEMNGFTDTKSFTVVR